MAYEVHLAQSNTIPCYLQEQVTYCGPAVAAMILEGYPNQVEHQKAQGDLETEILRNNRETNPPNEVLFWTINSGTDPQGMQVTLHSEGSETEWTVIADGNWQKVMFAVVDSVSRNSYPAAVLVRGLTHWVVVDGIVTDRAPSPNGTVALTGIEFIDPATAVQTITGGTHSLSDAWVWYRYYWRSVEKTATGSIWNEKFVAVVASPCTAGDVTIMPQAERGVAHSPEAAAAAARFFRDANVSISERYGLNGVSPLQPLLVNAESYGYYIVPFGSDDVATAAIVINAYDLRFMQVSKFVGTIHYLTATEAWSIVAAAFDGGAPPPDAGRLIFVPSVQTGNVVFPAWEFRTPDRIMRVAQNRAIFGDFTHGFGGSV